MPMSQQHIIPWYNSDVPTHVIINYAKENTSAELLYIFSRSKQGEEQQR
jgi:hypothetical protein